VRLPSASCEVNRMKKATSAAGLRKRNHSQGQPPWARMIPCMESVPAIRTGVMMARPAGIS
jgi:hypothetical protein